MADRCEMAKAGADELPRPEETLTLEEAEAATGGLTVTTSQSPGPMTEPDPPFHPDPPPAPRPVLKKGVAWSFDATH